MKKTNRRARSIVNNVERLEQRRLLSATLLQAVPAQSVTAGGTGTQVNLATYLNDPSINGGTVVEMQTPLGNIPLELTDSRTPLTVANFKQYITNGQYTPTIIQRSAPGFVLQGGGTKPNGTSNSPLADVTSEAGISNTAGTIAVALSSGPNTGNNQWFINLANNASVLDGTNDGGPFTVFGNVIDAGMTVATAISNLQIINGSAENPNWYIGPNDGLPVINYTGSTTPTTVPQANLVTDNIVQLTGAAAAPSYSAVSANPAIVTASVSNNVLTLSTPAGVTSGTTSITATVTDLSGQTATSTFNVSVQGQIIPTLAIANASATVGQTTTLSFPVTLTAPSATDVTLNYTLVPGTAPAADFQATGSTLTIPAGSTTASIPVSVLNDSSSTAETFTISLSGLSTNAAFAVGGTSVNATGTIQPAIVTSVATATTLSETAPSVAVGGTDTFVATVTPLIAGATVAGTVNFTIDGTSIGTAAVTGGTATLTNVLNTPGTQSVVATYSGDSLYTTSTSNAVSVNVSTLTPAVAKSTVPVAVVSGSALHGQVAVSATNNTAATEKGIATFALYASTNGVIDANSVLIASQKKAVNLKTGKSVTVVIPVKTLPAALAAGTYTLLTQTTDTLGNVSNASTGPGVTIAAPFVKLVETISRLTLPPAVISGSKTSAFAQVRITNMGNINSVGTTSISLATSTDGSVAGAATPFKTLSRKIVIRAGKTIVLNVPLGTLPSVTNGNYFIVAEITDPNGGTSNASFATPVNIAAANIDLSNTFIALPPVATVGKSMIVTLDLANNGNITAAGKLQIAFSLSASSTGASPIALTTISQRINLKPTRQQTLRLRVPLAAGTPFGAFYVVSTIDPAHLFSDSDLTNNTAISPTPVTLG